MSQDRPVARSSLVTEVELALLAGRRLDEIEGEILAGSDSDEESKAAAWLYAWSCKDRAEALTAGNENRRRLPRPEAS